MSLADMSGNTKLSTIKCSRGTQVGRLLKKRGRAKRQYSALLAAQSPYLEKAVSYRGVLGVVVVDLLSPLSREWREVEEYVV